MKDTQEIRGDLVLIGDRGDTISDSHKGKSNAVVGILLFIALFATIWTILTPGVSSFHVITDPFYARIAFWLAFLPIVAILVYLADIIGLEVDAIYEKGISSRRATLIECRRGHGFVPFESISSIRLGREETPEGVVEVLTIYSGEPETPAFRPFANHGYENDFWNRLIQTLRNQCPNAKWHPAN